MIAVKGNPKTHPFKVRYGRIHQHSWMARPLRHVKVVDVRFDQTINSSNQTHRRSFLHKVTSTLGPEWGSRPRTRRPGSGIARRSSVRCAVSGSCRQSSLSVRLEPTDCAQSREHDAATPLQLPDP